MSNLINMRCNYAFRYISNATGTVVAESNIVTVRCMYVCVYVCMCVCVCVCMCMCMVCYLRKCVK